MAGDWIKMRADLFAHPKVDALAERFGKDELWAVGALFSFWVWADKHCVDGRVDGATSRLIDRATRVDGLANALVAIGWLVIDDAGISIPDFGEHNGESAKERSQKNQRQARWRDRKAAGLVDVSPSTSSSTKTSTREEKRREEKKDKAPTNVDAFFSRVSEKVVTDFKTLRKSKKAPITETALEGIKREAEKAGLTFEAALKTCCERGWVGFKAEWITGEPSQTWPRPPKRQML